MIQEKQALNFLEDWRQVRSFDHEFKLLDIFKEENLNDEPGVYIIVSSKGTSFVYPGGNSKVIYIGMSKHLRTRLIEHYSHLMELEENPEYGMKPSEPWVSSRYQYMHKFGAKVYTYKCLGAQDEKNLESQVMWAFYKKFRSLPVGNSARSYSKED